MLCPNCKTELLEKSYRPGDLIHGKDYLIGKARLALTILFCNFCNSYKTVLEKEKASEESRRNFVAPVKAEAV